MVSNPAHRPVLPIDEVLHELGAALNRDGMAVLQAPPGAGKTTRVPLHLLEHSQIDGRILMLEPRRVAARSAAEHMASLLGEKVGQTIGYRMRGEAKTGKATRIEVITEGVLTRLLNADPELRGVGCVIFDEFHERSLQADLGLALSLEVKAALRPDLRLLVMSATLDAAPVAALMGGAPVITSEGRSFDVDTHWLERPRKRAGRYGEFERALAQLVERAAQETEGGILVFCPGAGEIKRLRGLLDLPAEFAIAELYGAMPFKDQLHALAPTQTGRKVVLATAIAETSLTIPDIRVVVDGGLSRRPRFDPGSGMTRLVTEKVSQAEAEQRRGRAGRVAQGHCYRLWTKGEHSGLQAFPPVEIEDTDLTGLVLDLARWGARGTDGLAFLTAPPEPAITEATSLLKSLGALNADGALTPHGEKLSEMAVHPRLAHMVIRGRELGMGWTAPALAALIEARGLARSQIDMSEDLAILKSGAPTVSRDTRHALKRLGPGHDVSQYSAGAMASLAYPDRVAKTRVKGGNRYLMSGGKGAVLQNAATLEGTDWLVVCDLDGDAREARIRHALPVTEAELTELHPIEDVEICYWDKRRSEVVSERQSRLGAIVLKSRQGEATPEQILKAMIEGVREMGLDCLPWDKASTNLINRINWGRRSGMTLPDASPDGLMAGLENWLEPFLTGVTSKRALTNVDLVTALQAWIGWDALENLDAALPRKFKAPTGSGVSIDYSGEAPRISIRLQELMGITEHPTIGPKRIPLKIELLSPAQRPLQVTTDLPGFWKSSYADVRKEMRGRYPKHHWPENPDLAQATKRAKPRR